MLLVIFEEKQIRRPLLARGTKAAGFGLVRFFTISGHAFQLSGYAFISLEGSNRWLIRVPSSRSQDLFALLKIHYFQVWFQGLKSQKNEAQGPPKTRQIGPEID